MTNCLRSKSSKNLEPIVITSKRKSKRCLASEDISRRSLTSFTLMDQVILGKVPFVDIGFFLLKIAALDIVRRFSRAKCPFVWRGLQALQLFCYQPFKWIQRWDPFRSLVGCMQTLSRPMLFLSIATTISNLAYCEETSKSSDDAHEYSEPQSTPEPRILERLCVTVLLPLPSKPLLKLSNSAWFPFKKPKISDEVPEEPVSEKWLSQLHEELDKQGLTLPERINDDELRRFYFAANGEFSTLLSSVKKTIRWRQSYALLPTEDLEVWSHLVFWHGHDVRRRPCLMIRLGLAFSGLASSNKPGFAQAVVSQVEYGVLQLVDAENPQITVLMDCENLSPFRFPMQMMRSIAVLLQDHYPNRLGCLFVIRLPPVARVIIQTLTQVLKPVTRQKLRIVGGKNYHKVLSEFLQTLPSFLGGQCSCPKCASVISIQGINKETRKVLESAELTNEDDISPPSSYDIDTSTRVSCNQVLRTAIIGLLMLWIFIALIVALHDP